MTGTANILLILCQDPISRYSVLMRFNDSLFAGSHCLTLARSQVMVICNLEIDLPDGVNVVSSAIIFVDEYSKVFEKSLI